MGTAWVDEKFLAAHGESQEIVYAGGGYGQVPRSDSSGKSAVCRM